MKVADERRGGDSATMALSSKDYNDVGGQNVVTEFRESRTRILLDFDMKPNGDPPSLTLWGTDEEK